MTSHIAYQLCDLSVQHGVEEQQHLVFSRPKSLLQIVSTVPLCVSLRSTAFGRIPGDVSCKPSRAHRCQERFAICHAYEEQERGI